jgi:SulP family sulfate permease
MVSTFAQKLARNWRSGLSIAVVSVPLSISFAIASGAEPIMGLITSAWAGLVAALFGGSNFNVISPAGAFAGILTVVSITYGIEAIPIVTMLAGIFMFVGYLLNVQRFLRFVPGGAIFGFTLGIAAIIAGSQINAAFGLSGLPTHETILLNIIESLRHLPSFDLVTTVIFLSFLGLLFGCARFIKHIPSIILVTPLGILLGWLSTQGVLGISVLTLQGMYGELEAQIVRIPHIVFDTGFIVPAITIALVGILETMLSAKIADNMTDTRHHPRKEMRGLALANVVSGLVGGMPATGVLGPTVLNINMQAESRISAAIKAVSVALITLVFFFLFKYIPMPVIAAILFYVALSMVQTKKFWLYYKHDKYALGIGLIVAALTLYKDPAMGILVGSFIGLLIFAEQVSRGSYQAVHNSSSHDKKVVEDKQQAFTSKDNFNIIVYSVRGVLSHLSSDAHLERIGSIDADSTTHVVIRLREVSYVDIEGIEALDRMIDMLGKKQITVLLSGIHEHMDHLLRIHSKHYSASEKQGQVFVKTRYALKSLGVPLPEEK